MMETFKMKYSILLFSLFLFGCAVVPAQPVAIGPPPTKDQSLELVNEYIHASFFDPYSVQDLSVEPPVQRGNMWQIYFSCNAKNRMGGYVGKQRSILDVRNNQIDWPAQRSMEFWNQV